MNKYIDVERLKAEIERVRQDWLGDSTGLEVGESGAALGAAESILNSIDNIITSLQQEQPEVDLEKELDKFYGMYRKDGKTYDIEDDQECVDWKETCNPYFEIAFVRHFYELGLNVRKEE